jgi:hypothetical protein
MVREGFRVTSRLSQEHKLACVEGKAKIRPPNAAKRAGDQCIRPQPLLHLHPCVRLVEPSMATKYI